MTVTRDTAPVSPAARTTSPPLLGALVAIAAVVCVWVLMLVTVEPARALARELDGRLPTLLWCAAVAAIALSVADRAYRRRREAPVWYQTWQRRVSPMLAPAGFACGILTFVTGLAAKWERGTTGLTIGGIVQVGDSGIYHGGALRLLFDGQLDDWGSRRPLNAGFLAARLAATGLDLHWTLLLQAILLGVACSLAAYVVSRDVGWAAGITMFAALYTFGDTFVGLVQTEALGLALGALAFAMLWPAVRRRDVALAAAGLFVLTLALTVRSGPFLLVVALALWLAWTRGRDRRVDWRTLGVFAAAIVAAIGVNVAAVLATNGDASALSGNDGYVLYATARGSPGWTAVPNSLVIYDDHPEIAEMNDVERGKFARREAFEELRDHPQTFVTTAAASAANYAEFVRDVALDGRGNTAIRTFAVVVAGGVCVVAFWARRRRAVPIAVDAALLVGALLSIPMIVSLGSSRLGPLLAALAVGGFVFVGVERLGRLPQLGLVLVGLGSLALSIPFLGVESVRVFAGALPFFAVPAALAAGALSRIGAPAPAQPPATATRAGWAAGIVAFGTVAIAVLGAPLAVAVVEEPTAPRAACASGTRSETLLVASTVHIVHSGSPTDALDEVDAAATSALESSIVAELRPHLRPSGTVIGAITPRGDERIALARGLRGAEPGDALAVCVRDIETEYSDRSSAYWPSPYSLEIVRVESVAR